MVYRKVVKREDPNSSHHKGEKKKPFFFLNLYETMD